MTVPVVNPNTNELPFAYNQLSMQPRQYDQSNVPVRFNPPVAPQVAMYVNALTAAILNQAATEATDPTRPWRTYAFNSLVSNNFQNQYLMYVVCLGCDYLTVAIAQNSVGEINACINGIAAKVFKFYMLRCILENTATYGFVPEQVRGAMVIDIHNAMAEKTKVDEFANYSYNQLMQSAHTGQPVQQPRVVMQQPMQQQGYPQHQQQSYPQPVIQTPMFQPGYPQQGYPQPSMQHQYPQQQFMHQAPQQMMRPPMHNGYPQQGYPQQVANGSLYTGNTPFINNNGSRPIDHFQGVNEGIPLTANHWDKMNALMKRSYANKAASGNTQPVQTNQSTEWVPEQVLQSNGKTTPIYVAPHNRPQHNQQHYQNQHQQQAQQPVQQQRSYEPAQSEKTGQWTQPRAVPVGQGTEWDTPQQTAPVRERVQQVTIHHTQPKPPINWNMPQAEPVSNVDVVQASHTPRMMPPKPPLGGYFHQAVTQVASEQKTHSTASNEKTSNYTLDYSQFDLIWKPDEQSARFKEMLRDENIAPPREGETLTEFAQRCRFEPKLPVDDERYNTWYSDDCDFFPSDVALEISILDRMDQGASEKRMRANHENHNLLAQAQLGLPLHIKNSAANLKREKLRYDTLNPMHPMGIRMRAGTESAKAMFAQYTDEQKLNELKEVGLVPSETSSVQDPEVYTSILTLAHAAYGSGINMLTDTEFKEMMSLPKDTILPKLTTEAKAGFNPTNHHPNVVLTPVPGEDGIPVGGDKTVDREAHRVGSVRRTLVKKNFAAAEKLSKAMEESAKQLRLMLDNLAQVEPTDEVLKEIADFSSTVLVNDGTFITESSLETGIFNLQRTFSLVSTEEDASKVYQGKMFLCEPIICAEEPGEKIREAMSSTRIDECTQKLKEILKDPKVSRQTIMVVDNLDKRLTKAVNSVLANNLGLDVTIDSVLDEYNDPTDSEENPQSLLPYLRIKKGAGFCRAMIANETRILRSSCMIGDKETSDSLCEDLFPVGEYIEVEEGVDQQPELLLNIKNVSATIVNVHSSELGFDFSGANVGAVNVLESNRPQLFKLIKRLIDDAEKFETVYAHLLLITADGERYELHKSFVSKDIYLISKFRG